MRHPHRRLTPMPWLAGSALALAAALPVHATTSSLPYAMPDDAWISIDGTVQSVRPDSFTLDYGEGVVIIEMDDGDRDADGYKLIEGDVVNVIGKVDDDLFERTTVEAASVYVQKLETTFYASAVDEEDVVLTVARPLATAQTIVRGTVATVGDDSFTIEMGETALTVDTASLGYDPLDDAGYQRVEPGDRVSVSGDMDDRFFRGPELDADALVVLEDARGGGSDASGDGQN